MSELYNNDELRTQLTRLLKQQSETLQARVFGGVSETEILEYDIRQEVIAQIEERLARSAAA
jgi:hypothetical protein